MADRERYLRSLAARLAEREALSDAWLAKSFTDLLLVVEVPADEPLPDAVVCDLREAGLVGYNDLHDVSAADSATAGTLADADRYRFVDPRSRGTQQSYVVE